MVLAVLLSTACDAGSPEPSERALPECDVHVEAPTDLQHALNDAGPRAVVCLTGTFETVSTVRPLTGQTVVGGLLRYVGAYDVCRECYASMVDGYDLGAADVTLQGVEVAGFEGRGVLCGSGSAVTGSFLHDNRRNGIGCIARGANWHIQIVGNRIEHNGTEVLAGQASGGVKLMEVSQPGEALGVGAVVSDNTVANNIGNGIWLDRSSNASTIERNSLSGNTQTGIRCEKCGGPIAITDNVSYDNGGDGLAILNSAVVSLAGDQTYGNAGVGIRIGYTSPGVATKVYPDLSPVSDGWQISSIVVNDTRLAADEVVGCDLTNVDCAA
jgi:parallel beta-helix repeat protein